MTGVGARPEVRVSGNSMRFTWLIHLSRSSSRAAIPARTTTGMTLTSSTSQASWLVPRRSTVSRIGPYQRCYTDVKSSVAVPHQPRLDWQMWFAALGSYQHNPWLISLCVELMEGNRDVSCLYWLFPFDLTLVDGRSISFWMKSNRFHWTNQLRTSVFSSTTTFIPAGARYCQSTADRFCHSQQHLQNTTDWWTRKLKRVYFGPLEYSRGLKQYLNEQVRTHVCNPFKCR